MKRLFLASAGSIALPRVVKLIGHVRDLRLLFVITAAEAESGDWPWIRADREALEDAGFVVSDYTIAGKRRDEIAGDLRSVDVLYVAGGNTFYLLEKIQQSGCAGVIRDFVASGKIYIGSSAGAVVAGPDIYPTYSEEDVQKAPNLKGYEGLGLVDFVPLTHWGNEYYKDYYLGQRMPLAYGINHKYILVNDDQFIEVKDDSCRIFSALESAS